MLRGRCEHMAIFNYYILERRWMGTLPRKIDYATMTFGATTILTARNSSMSSAGSDCMERIVRTSRLILNPSNKWSGYHHYNIQPCLEMDFHCTFVSWMPVVEADNENTTPYALSARTGCHKLTGVVPHNPARSDSANCIRLPWKFVKQIARGRGFNPFEIDSKNEIKHDHFIQSVSWATAFFWVKQTFFLGETSRSKFKASLKKQ